jgi:hypothetical protein
VITCFPVAGYMQQDSAVSVPHKFHVSGYVKDLQQTSFTKNTKDLITGNLLHNRINLRYDLNSHITARLEMRNRLYYGETVRSTPGFAAMLKNNSDLFDLSKTWVDEPALVLNSTIDRASVNFRYGKWDMTVGRQRINWGINTIWTPNDIFNTFNYFDFDYEERPGSDAVRIHYLRSGFSSFEAAYRPGKNEHDQVGALLYRFNKWNYDIQFFAGIYNDDVTAGTGWAGNIGNAGFKGEATYFHPRDNFADTSGVLNTSVTIDYAFRHGIYFCISALYNSGGKDHFPLLYNFSSATLSAKNLMPFRYTLFIQASKAFTPILAGTLACMYSPADNTVVALPSLSYSISDNWELSLTAQSFFASQQNIYRGIYNSIFLRIKMAF